LLSVRILLVDDNETVRRGLRSFLSSRPDFLICGEAVDGLDSIEKAKALQPDVVLMDITMPRMSGLDATRIIRRELPESKILIVSQNDPAIIHRQAQEVGAAGSVAKADVSRDLMPMIETFAPETRKSRQTVHLRRVMPSMLCSPKGAFRSNRNSTPKERLKAI
jgi:DNA-binding NarL/FixJ family response regulator